jgi:hypothetical protein
MLELTPCVPCVFKRGRRAIMQLLVAGMESAYQIISSLTLIYYFTNSLGSTIVTLLNQLHLSHNITCSLTMNLALLV